jgi:hypothetical protein
MPFDASFVKRTISGLAKPALGVFRYALTLLLFCGIWWFDARYLNWAFDLNLAVIKRATSVFDGSGKAEAMMRAFAAEKMLLFAEGSALIWGIGRIASESIRWLFNGPGRPASLSAESVPKTDSGFFRGGGNR